jgi:penicillin-binding protein 2
MIPVISVNSWIGKRGGHGQANFFKGLSQSVDVYFYKISGGYGDEVKEGLGPWRMSEYAKALGYGALTELNCLARRKGWYQPNLEAYQP